MNEFQKEEIVQTFLLTQYEINTLISQWITFIFGIDDLQMSSLENLLSKTQLVL